MERGMRMSEASTEEAVVEQEKVQLGLQTVSISEIRENPVALRTVNTESESYLGIVASIREKGFMGAICVRPQVAEDGSRYFELVDGLHRFAAAKDAGLTEINVDVKNLNDDQTLEAQIMANIHKVETKPVEYSQQLKRILIRNPLMAEGELAKKLGKSPQWIKERLGLNRIDNEVIVELINEGQINLTNAYALAKLPAEEMADFSDRAMTLDPKEFVPQVNARAKEIRDAKRAGKDAGPAEFVPVAFMQKIGAIKDELENGSIAEVLIPESGAKTAADGFKLAINWILHLDPKSVEAQKAKDEERQAQRKAAKKIRTVEKAEKKAADDKAKAEKSAKLAEEAKEAAAKEASEGDTPPAAE